MKHELIVRSPPQVINNEALPWGVRSAFESPLPPLPLDDTRQWANRSKTINTNRNGVLQRDHSCKATAIRRPNKPRPRLHTRRASASPPAPQKRPSTRAPTAQCPSRRVPRRRRAQGRGMALRGPPGGRSPSRCSGPIMSPGGQWAQGSDLPPPKGSVHVGTHRPVPGGRGPGRDPRRDSGLCHVCTGGSQHKAQKENGFVSGL